MSWPDDKLIPQTNAFLQLKSFVLGFLLVFGRCFRAIAKPNCKTRRDEYSRWWRKGQDIGCITQCDLDIKAICYCSLDSRILGVFHRMI